MQREGRKSADCNLQCLPVPASPRWNGSSNPHSSSTLGHRAATQLSSSSWASKMGCVVPGELGSSPSEAPRAVAVTGDCRHRFCSVSTTAALSCRQVLKEEECKTRWVLSSHTDHAHGAADQARLAQQPL